MSRASTLLWSVAGGNDATMNNALSGISYTLMGSLNREEENMKKSSRTSIMIATAFLLGFGLGGLSLHYASAQGMFGLSTSVSQLGSALVDMQKNVDDLQKNMGTVKQVKDQLTSLSSQGGGIPGGEQLKKGTDSLKDKMPKF